MKGQRYMVATFCEAECEQKEASTIEGQPGLFWAVLLEDPTMVGLGPDRIGACKNLVAKMEHFHAEFGYEPRVVGGEYRLDRVKVDITPEYQVGHQTLPSRAPLQLSFACVVGQYVGNLQVCVIPSLQIVFYFENGRNLREISSHYVQRRFSGFSPQEAVRNIGPVQLELAEVKVRHRAKKSNHESDGMQHLPVVADPAHRLKLRGFGRDQLVNDLVEALSGGLSVALVGPPSAGKTTSLVEAARRLQKRAGNKPTVWKTSAARIVAGMCYLGMWEERCECLVDELGGVSGILAVESATELIRQGGREPSGGVAAFLTPYLTSGLLQMVVESTPNEWSACRRLLPSFTDVFRVLEVPAMTEQQTREVLAIVRSGLAQSRALDISSEVDLELVGLFHKFWPYHALPGSAARFFRRLAHQMRRGESLRRSQVVRAFTEESGIPERFLRDDLPMEPEWLHERLSRQVIGQPQAVEAAARVITAFKAGLNDPGRPLGVLLLCGPTGVGKTELAKCIAELLFSDAKRLIRLDMSEYAAPGSAARLLGSLYDEQMPSWLRQLRQRPFSVLLFDEVEKAHPEVYDVLMRAFDEGQITDPWGRMTTLRTTVILLTSNLGVQGQRSMGLTPDKGPSFQRAVAAFFRPELINRLDQIVIFQPLMPHIVQAIARREIELLNQRPGLHRRGLTIQASERALGQLAQLGYDIRMGARPLQRLIEKEIVPLILPVIVEQLSHSEPATGKGISGKSLLVDWRDGAFRVHPTTVAQGDSSGA